MRQLRGVIFDLDGTLGDTLPICFAAFRKTFEVHLGRSFRDDEIRAMFGPTEEGILQRRFPDRWEAALATYLEEYERAHAACVAPFAGIEAVLDTLRAIAIRCAIVTGKGPRSAEISARRLGLTRHFEVIETGSAERPIKSDGIRAVLARWALPPEDVAYVGDAPSDVTAAREVGLVALGAAWAATADTGRLTAQAPDALFSTVASFAAWVDGNVIRGR